LGVPLLCPPRGSLFSAAVGHPHNERQRRKKKKKAKVTKTDKMGINGNNSRQGIGPTFSLVNFVLTHFFPYSNYTAFYLI
jgi:hypothetical protein